MACGGPMLMTWTAPPCFSLIRRASSTAYSSKGFMMLATPSRIKVFVLGLIFTSVESGTCLMQTAIFTFSSFSSLKTRIQVFPEARRKPVFIIHAAKRYIIGQYPESIMGEDPSGYLKPLPGPVKTPSRRGRRGPEARGSGALTEAGRRNPRGRLKDCGGSRILLPQRHS